METAKENLAIGLNALGQEAATCCALCWPGATPQNDFKCAGGQCCDYLISIHQ